MVAVEARRFPYPGKSWIHPRQKGVPEGTFAREDDQCAELVLQHLRILDQIVYNVGRELYIETIQYLLLFYRDEDRRTKVRLSTALNYVG